MIRLGWALFLIGSVLFAVAAIRQGDLVTATGSVMFVVGVGAFLIAERLPMRCSSCRRRISPDRDPNEKLCKRCADRRGRARERSRRSERLRVDRAAR
jgi:hypothetical protein